MTLQITDEEFDEVCALDAAERYTYFVKRVCDSRVVWTLRASNGFVMMGDDETGEEYIPVWPAERYAAVYAGEDEKPEAIPLDVWMERWLPGLAGDDSGIAVFPIEGDSGAVVPLDEHRADLVNELGIS